MKTAALAALLLLLALTTYGQDTWPRNPKTGKVEFRGTLPWPASVRTDAQRKALAWRWYLKRLTDQSEPVVRASARKETSLALLTYAGLPSIVSMGNATPPNPGILAYIVTLRAGAGGLSYNLTGFDFSREGGASGEQASEIEQVLDADAPDTRPALAALRKRLAVAVASW